MEKATREMTVKIYNKGKVWKLESETVEDITETFYKNMTEKATLRFFRNLGGSETMSGSTLTSINPDNTVKIVRTFKLI